MTPKRNYLLFQQEKILCYFNIEGAVTEPCIINVPTDELIITNKIIGKKYKSY